MGIVDYLIGLKRDCASLDAIVSGPDGEGETAFGELLPDPQAANPEAELLRREREELARGLLAVLPVQQRVAVELVVVEELTLRDAGEALGRSGERVRQLAAKAIETMRQAEPVAVSAPSPSRAEVAQAFPPVKRDPGETVLQRLSREREQVLFEVRPRREGE